MLAKEGAAMLVDVLKSGAFVPPLKDVGWYNESGGPVEHAGKITKNQREVDFKRDTLQDILKIQRVIHPAYCILPNGARLILEEIEDAGYSDTTKSATTFSVDEATYSPLVRLHNGETLRIKTSTYEGQKSGSGNLRLLRLIRDGQI